MKLFAALLIIVFIAFSGYHLTFRSFRLPLFTRTFYMTGIEYLFMGLLLGPQFLNLLDQVTLSNLAPLSALLLGWVGLLCGFQFELSGLKIFPRNFLVSSLVEIMVTFTLIFACLILVLPVWFTLSGPQYFMAATGFAAAATCTAQTGIALLTADTLNKRSYLVNYLRYLSSMSSIGALVFFSVVFLFSKEPHMDSGLFGVPSAFAVVNVLVANVALILLFNLFLTQKRERNEIALILIGMVIVTSGAAIILGFSPLLANFVMGVILVNTRREKDRLFDLLILAEKPLYLLLLVFLGATWLPDGIQSFFLASVFVIIQMSAKLTAGFAASCFHTKNQSIPAYLGIGLMEQGGISLAIYFDMTLRFNGHIIDELVGIAIMALIVGDMISPSLIGLLINPDQNISPANADSNP